MSAHSPLTHQGSVAEESEWTPIHYDDFEDDAEECWDCGGAGGFNSCQEDCCPHVWGEEGCDDPVCWRRCPTCRGKGYLE